MLRAEGMTSATVQSFVAAVRARAALQRPAPRRRVR
jgi:hypothetical protein